MDANSTASDDPLKKALRRVAELEEALRVSETAARSANQDLQHFVYAASHDLQEPLRAVTTYSQLLERLHSDDPQTSELTSFITSGVARMNSLLYSLLAYSRMNMFPVLTQVNLEAPVHAAIYKLNALIQQTKAEIHFASLPQVAAHEAQLSQLFEHLINNALLYRCDKPVVEIGATETELDGDAFHLVGVKDNGVGIEPQFLSQAVQPFKRLHGKDIPGNGLGLAICEKIMRAHKGKLWLESDGVNGTSVMLAFPV